VRGEEKAESGDWDITLDDEFVKAGRRERTAAERAADARRIAAAHPDAAGWRNSTFASSPASHSRLRSITRTLGALLALAALGTVGWYVRDLVPAPSSESAVPDEARVIAAPRLAASPPKPKEPGDYRFLQKQSDGTGRPVAFDPCREITYVVRVDHEPAEGKRLLDEAFHSLAAATGLVFRYVGQTNDAPRLHTQRSAQEGMAAPPVLVAWSDERETPDLAGYITGVGGPSDIRGSGPGTWHYTSGQVVLDAADLTRMLEQRSQGPASVEATILHELGHLVGLGHVADRRQIMFSEGVPGVNAYASGDLAGLREVGRGDCFAA
jgi:hypothetical protein